MLLYVALIAIANLVLGYLAGLMVGRRSASTSIATEPSTSPYTTTMARPAPPVESDYESATAAPAAAVRDDYALAGHQPETIETAVENFWRADPLRQRDLALAMVDVDRCEQLNVEYGPAAVDEVLERISSLLVDPNTQRSLTVWHGGQRFVILLADWVAVDATEALEHIRRTIEETQFQHFGQSLSVTVSCAVAASLMDDTAGGLLERLNVTLKAAKLQGRNKTFLHAGEQPTLVESAAALVAR